MARKSKKTSDARKLNRQDNTSAAHASFSSKLSGNDLLDSASKAPAFGNAPTVGVHIALIIFLILIVYSNSLQVPFQWDEETHIVNEPIIKDLNYFIHPSTAQGFENYRFFISRYIPHLTFAINYRIHGLSLPGYHIVNNAIHIANAILVYLFVLLTFRTPFFLIKTDSGQAGMTGSPKSQKLSGVAMTAESRNSPSLLCHSGLSGIASRSLIAFFSAAIFAVHPLQTAAVTYVMQRFASLVTFFYLLSITAYIKFRLETPDNHNARRWTLYAITLISAVLAMKTKENAFTLPFVVMLYEFCFFSVPSPRVSASPHLRVPLSKRLLYLAPILLSLCIIPLTIMSMPTVTTAPGTHLINPSFIDPGSYMAGFTWRYSPGEYFYTQFRVIVTYLRMLFFPTNLGLDYEYPVFKSFFDLPVILSFLFLSALFGLGAYLVLRTERRGLRTEGEGLKAEGRGLRAKNEDQNSVLSTQSSVLSTQSLSLSPQSSVLVSPFSPLSPAFRLIGFGILWFFITLAVESIITTPRVIETYRVYLPSVGAIVSIVTGLFLLKEKVRVQNFREGMLVLLVIVTVVLSVATYMRNEAYGDKIRMWEETAKRFPANAGVHLMFGKVYGERNMFAKAIEQNLIAVKLKPDYPEAHYNLGNNYKSMGMFDKAMEQYFIAVKLKPDYVEAHNNLGNNYQSIGMFDKAIEQYLIAVKLKPDSFVIHNNLGNSYQSIGMLDKAIEQYLTAIKLKPDLAEAHSNLALIYYKMGQKENARSELITILKIKPDDQKAQQLLNEISR